MKQTLFAFIFLFFTGSYVFSQCPNNNANAFCPAFDASTLTINNRTLLCVTVWAGEYQQVNNITAGNTYRVDFCPFGGSTDYDSYLTIYTDAGTLVAFNDNFCGDDPQVDFVAPVSGGYRILADAGAGCGSNSVNTYVNITLLAVGCTTPNAPTGTLSITNSTCTNCVLGGGSIAIGSVAGSGGTLQYSTDNGATWSSTLPVYNQSGPAQTILASVLAAGGCRSNTTPVGTTVPGTCSTPNAPTGALVITNSTCTNCVLGGGSINIGSVAGSGGTLQYSTDNGATWSSTLPVYNQSGPAQTILASVLAAGGCRSNTTPVGTTVPGTCSTPNAPTGALAINNSTCTNCVLGGGSIAIGSVAGSGGTLQYSTDNGVTWSSTLPVYNQSGPAQTILASVLAAGGCRSNTTPVGTTVPGTCSTPNAPTGALAITNSTCTNCVLGGGSIAIGSVAGSGGTLQYSTDNGATWSSTLPAYNQSGPAQTILASVLAAGGCRSNTTPVGTTVPGTCSTPNAPTGALAINNSTCTNCVLGGGSIAIGSVAGSGGTLQYSTDNGVTWSSTLPAYNQSGPAQTILASVLAAGGCRSNTTPVGTTVPGTCSTPNAPTGALAITNSTCSNCVLGGGSIAIGSVAGSGGTLQYSTDNGATWSSTLPVYNQSGPAQTILASVLAAGGCRSNTTPVGTTVPGTCTTPNAPTGALAISNSTCTNCVLGGGSIAIGSVAGSGGTLQYSTDNGATWSSTLPVYNQSGPAQTILASVLAAGGCRSNTTPVGTTVPGTCSTPNAPTGALAISNSTCTNCVLGGGSIAIGSVAGSGGTLQYSTDNGATWSSTLPAYNQSGPAQTILASVLAAGGCRSNTTPVGTTVPGTCSTPNAPTGALAINNSTCSNCVLGGGSIAIGSVAGSGGTLQYSTDNGATWSSTLPVYNQSGPAQTILASVLAAGGCRSNTTPVGTTVPGTCSTPNAPTGALAINNSTCTNCVLGGGSINIGTVAGSGGTLEYSTDNGVSWSSTLPVYNQSGPAQTILASVLATNGCRSNTTPVGTTVPGTCSTPNTPTGALAITNSTCTNCVLSGGNIAIGTVSGSGGTLEYSTDNGVSWSSTLPVYNQSGPAQTILASVLATNGCRSNSIQVGVTTPGSCSGPATPTGTLAITNSTCSNCVLGGGSINIGTVAGSGGTLEYSTDNGATWSSTLPVYNQSGPAQTILASVLATNGCRSNTTPVGTTVPGTCTTPNAPTGTLAITNSTCSSCVLGGGSITIGSVAGSGGTLEYSTDNGVSWSSTLPVYNQSGPAQTILASVLAANGCRSNSIQVGVTTPGSCAGPATPTGTLAITNSTCSNCVLGGGSINIGTVAGSGGTLEYSTDNGATWSSTLPVYNQSGPAQTILASVFAANGCRSNSLQVGVTTPGTCTTPNAPTGALAITNSTCSNCALSGGSIAIGTVSGSGGTLEYSTDNGVSWSSTLPVYNQSGPAQTILASVLAANGCRSNSIQVGVTTPGSCSGPATPTGTLAITNSTCSSCVLGGGSITIGSVAGSGGTLEYSTDNGVSWSSSLPVYNQSGPAQTILASVLAANGCRSNSAQVGVTTPGSCSGPATPTGTLAITNSTCSNCVLSGGSIAIGTVAGSGGTLEYSTDNGVSWSSSLPVYNQSGPAQTILASVLAANGCRSNSIQVGVTTPGTCTTPNAPTGTLAVTNSTCSNCVLSGGSITIGTVAGSGGTLEYSTDNGVSWSSTLPVYNQSGPAQTILASVLAANGCRSNSIQVGVTTPGSCAGPATPTGTLAITNSTCSNCVLGGGSINIGTVAGSGGTLEYSTDNGATWSSTLPVYNQSGPAQTILASVLAANGCRSNSLQVGVTTPGTCTTPNAPTGALAITNSTCSNCALSGGSIAIGTVSGSGGTLEYSTDNGVSWSSTLPVYNQSGPVQTILASVLAANGCRSNSLQVGVTTPGTCTTPNAPTGALAITNSTCTNCVLSGGSINIGTVAGSGGTLEYSTDNGATWSSTLPVYNQSGPAQTILASVLAANGCRSNSLQVGVTTPGTCTTPNAPTGALAITNSTCSNCALSGGSIAIGTVSGSGGTLEYSTDNGVSWSSTLPVYNQSGPVQTILASVLAANGCRSNSIQVGVTTPGSCSGPATPTGALAITNSTCSNCVLSGGSINIGTVAGSGGTLEYSTDNGATWSSTLPVYNQSGPAQTILASVLAVNGCRSNSIQVGVTSPSTCTTPNAPTGTLAIINSTCSNCVLSGGSIAIGTVSGSGGTLEYSTDNGVSWSSSLPVYNQSGPAQTILASVLAANGCRSNSIQVGVTTPGSCAGPATPTGTLAITNSTCSNCVLGGGSIAIGTVAGSGGTLEYSTDNGTTWSSTLPVYNQSGPAQTILASVLAANGCRSNSLQVGVTSPGSCTTPTANISSNNGFELDCENPQATLSVPAASSYAWTRNGNSFGSTQQVLVTQAGTYAVTVTAANGCTASSSVVVSYASGNATPSITCPANLTVCSNPVTNSWTGVGLEPTIPADNCGPPTLQHRLNNQNFQSGDANGRSFAVGSTTVSYLVSNTLNASNSATCSFSVTVRKTPNPFWSQAALSICNGASINLASYARDSRSAAKRYNFYSGDANGGNLVFLGTATANNGNVNFGQNRIVTPAGNNNAPVVHYYYLVAVNTFNNGPSCEGPLSAALVITVNPTPSLTASVLPAGQICPGNPVNISFSSSIPVTVYWSNSNTGIGLAANGTGNISFNAAAPGAATIFAQASAGACGSAPLSIPIAVSSCSNNRMTDPGADPFAGAGAPQLYPNPTNGQLFLRLPESDAPVLYATRIEFFDAAGRRVWSEAFELAGGAVRRIDLSRLPAGVYGWTLRVGDAGYHGRVVKE